VTPTSNPTPIQASAPDLAVRVLLILTNLALLVAAHLIRHPRHHRVTNALWGYLNRTARRFGRLMARIAAKGPRKPRPSRPHAPRPGRVRPTPLPTGYAWLLRAIPNEAACLASQLNAVLAEPGTADLLAACPAAARMLRPLGRMLGMESFAPRRIRPKRPAAIPRAPEPPPPAPPQDPDYRPSAKWPKCHWPRPSWPPAAALPEPA
jgi:hypothetical protein